MKKFLALVTFSLVLTAAAPAAAASQMLVSIGHRASVSSGSATVPVSVTCTFQQATSQTSGTVTITVTQSTQAGDVTATGSTQGVICDGVTRTYLVTATPTSGQFRAGWLSVTASAEASGSFQEQVCIDNWAGEQQCSTWSGTEVLQGSDGPDAVLATGGR